MPPLSANKAAYAGFETQRKHHQKSKTGISVAQQKGLMSSNFFYKKKKKRLQGYTRTHTTYVKITRNLLQRTVQVEIKILPKARKQLSCSHKYDGAGRYCLLDNRTFTHRVDD